MPPRSIIKPLCTLDHEHQHGANATCYTSGKCRCDPCTGRASAYARWRRSRPTERLAYSDVPALVTRRRLQALVHVGYSPAAMGRHLGIHSSLVWRWAKSDRVTRVTEARVARLYVDLAFTPPVPNSKSERISVTKARTHARRMGWAGPLDWDDITDPSEHPTTNSAADTAGWVVNELAHMYSLGEPATTATTAFKQAPASLERAAERAKRPDLAAWIRTARKDAA